ncbi:hypothetical protein [Actinoallomurus sp. CA-150999]|uniref:hypothetical protein n=1 Tax=Actinoallomurus sp. CA-150999 TaxID=3239887 RepID=UPI003D8CB25E
MKPTLFLAAGRLLNRFGTLDEHDLHGRGRGIRVSGTVFLLSGLGLAGAPPFGLWAGKSLMDEAAGRIG